MRDVVPQREVARELGGVRWNAARQVVESLGLRVLDDGPRRWLVLRQEWEPVRRMLEQVRRGQAVAS